MGSCPDTDIVTSRFFFSNIKNVEFFFTVFALLPYESFTNENWPSLILVEFSWRSIVFPKLTDVTYHHIPLAAKKQGFIDYCGIIKLTGVFMFHS